jgi:hypothetical protein
MDERRRDLRATRNLRQKREMLAFVAFAHDGGLDFRRPQALDLLILY